MSWISLTLETDDAHAEILSDALLELGALSTDIHDAAAGTEREQSLFDEPGGLAGEIWSASELTALFEADADITSIVRAASQAAQLPGPPTYHLTHVEEQDWVRITQSQFDPIQISSRLWIVPTWHEAPDPAAINLILDPGLAFDQEAGAAVAKIRPDVAIFVLVDEEHGLLVLVGPGVPREDRG